MPTANKTQNQIKQLVKEVKACKSFVLKSFNKITSKVTTADKNSKKWVVDEVNRIKELFVNLEQKTNSLEDNVASNNYLLEYKRKDLLVQADSLQDALDEISHRNKELETQKLHISEQAEKLKLSHQEIQEKNNELEQKTESLLDQADYLHEANETITHMHEEVQRQKTEIEEKSKELVALNLEKNNLIGIVAHDLKSPLNQIKGLAAIVKMTATALDAEALHCIDMIDKSATRLNEMINKILDVEAIESKKLNLNIEKVDLTKVLADLAERYLVSARQKQVEIFCTLEPNVFVEVDKGYTEQVFENILSNALKFSPAFRSVYVKLRLQDGKAITEIKDEGPGLNEEDKKKLFGKYQKLSAKPTGNETSTGLGLSIVKKFVEAMNGEIWCESAEGNGASFFVTFTANS
jgi:signal transduction histidine kinase